jgi:diguanylate cyclase (GGDEF)-like protein/PAS domain S-box-containing protein
MSPIIAPASASKKSARSSELLRLLADSIPALVAYFVRDEYRCVFANKAYARNFGLDEFSVVGKTVPEIIGAEAFAVIKPYVERVMQGETVRYERQSRLPDGSERTIEVTLIPHVERAGPPAAAFVLINDITRHHDAEMAIRESEERLQKFADATTEGIVFIDRGAVVDCNEATARMMRSTHAQLVGRPFAEFVVPEDVETVLSNRRAGFERPYEVTVIRDDGSRFPVETVGKDMVYAGVTHRMSVMRDITDRKEAEARIQFLAHHDTLTHLPNRALLLDRIQVILANARRNNTEIGIMFIDLDNFKTINDSLGHYAGDELLKRVASRLLSCLRDVDLVGRLGGDEFVVVLNELTSIDDIAPVAEKISEAIGEAFTLDGQVLAVSASIGVSVYPRDGETPDSLIRNADAAMYLAKERGRNNWQFFQPSLNRQAVQALALESGIRKAIKELEFTLHYQPVIRTNTRQPVTMEALVRWQHPELGLLGPDHFIPVAEHRGLIIPIGRWVINEAIYQAREWANLGVSIPVAINLSAVQFKQKDLVEDIANRLNEYGVSGEMLELELTESLFLEDVSAMSKILGRLKDLGVSLAVDDFGTGYSSLAYLKRYPIDKVKIDRSFVHDIPRDDDDVAITVAIINLAASLNLRVVAEGVETQEQAHFLEEHQCDFLQGYLIARPLPAADALAWLQRHRA